MTSTNLPLKTLQFLWLGLVYIEGNEKTALFRDAWQHFQMNRGTNSDNDLDINDVVVYLSSTMGQTLEHVKSSSIILDLNTASVEMLRLDVARRAKWRTTHYECADIPFGPLTKIKLPRNKLLEQISMLQKGQGQFNNFAYDAYFRVDETTGIITPLIDEVQEMLIDCHINSRLAPVVKNPSTGKTLKQTVNVTKKEVVDLSEEESQQAINTLPIKLTTLPTFSHIGLSASRSVQSSSSSASTVQNTTIMPLVGSIIDLTSVTAIPPIQEFSCAEGSLPVSLKNVSSSREPIVTEKVDRMTRDSQANVTRQVENPRTLITARGITNSSRNSIVVARPTSDKRIARRPQIIYVSDDEETNSSTCQKTPQRVAPSVQISLAANSSLTVH
jgi:hypothetical protein